MDAKWWATSLLLLILFSGCPDPATAATAEQSPSPTGAAAGTEQAAGGADPAKAPDGGVRVSFDDHLSLRVGSMVRLDLRGGVQADFRGSGADLSEAGGQFAFSRRRIGVDGQVTRYVEFQVEREIGATKAWRDVFVDVRLLQPLQVKIGRAKLPFSMDALTSPSELDFVFRSLLARQFAPGRETGVQLHGRLLDRRLSYYAGAFRHDGDNTPLDDRVGFLLPDEQPDASRGAAFAARVVASPFRPARKETGLFGSLRVGMSAVRSSVRDGDNGLRGETLFGATFFPRQLVNGPRWRVGAEAEWSPGPATIRAELAQTRDARQGLSVTDEDLPPLRGSAWYISGTWAIVDGRNGKRSDRRAFNAPLGRLELTGRVERLQMGGGSDAEPPSLSPRAVNPLPNAETAWTLGLNWSPNRWTEVQLNAIAERLDNLDRAKAVARSRWRTLVCRLQFFL